MMVKQSQRSGNLLSSNGSSSALSLKKNARVPLTHFGSEDAVSEKSEKDEESLSGSDGGSSD